MKNLTTKAQIVKLINNELSFAADFIKVNSKSEVEIYVERGGECDYEATEAVKDEFMKATGWGGFKCGYGAWVMQAGYRSCELVSNNID